jgi:hypothetical protein
MKYATEMGSGAMTYIPSSIKTGLAVQKLIGGEIHRDTDTYTDRMEIAGVYCYFFQNKISRLKSIISIIQIQDR